MPPFNIQQKLSENFPLLTYVKDCNAIIMCDKLELLVR